MDEVTNIVLAGVGGQGSILAGRIIARTAALARCRVATSEVHGMAQRGGSVFSTVRFGHALYSPVIPKGEADFLLGFELLEALRYLPYLRKDGVAIVNDQRITPTLEALKTAPYPEDAQARIEERRGRSVIVAGLEIARRIGDPRLANSVLLGALAVFLPFARHTWRRSLRELLPPDSLELNTKAFNAGRNAV